MPRGTYAHGALLHATQGLEEFSTPDADMPRHATYSRGTRMTQAGTQSQRTLKDDDKQSMLANAGLKSVINKEKRQPSARKGKSKKRRPKKAEMDLIPSLHTK